MLFGVFQWLGDIHKERPRSFLWKNPNPPPCLVPHTNLVFVPRTFYGTAWPLLGAFWDVLCGWPPTESFDKKNQQIRKNFTEMFPVICTKNIRKIPQNRISRALYASFNSHSQVFRDFSWSKDSNQPQSIRKLSLCSQNKYWKVF